jgi:hypothetical protein
VAHEGHSLDAELTEAEERGAQPRRHEHADEEDEGDRGDKPETCQKVMKPTFNSSSIAGKKKMTEVTTIHSLSQLIFSDGNKVLPNRCIPRWM